MFRGITTLLKDAAGFRITMHKLINRYSGKKIHKFEEDRIHHVAMISAFFRVLPPMIRTSLSAYNGSVA